MSTNYLQMLSKAEKVPMYTDLYTLDTYCEYLLNDRNKAINFSNLLNLHELVKSVDPSFFKGDAPKMARFEFVRLFLEARIEKGVVSRNACISHAMESMKPKYADIARTDIIDSLAQDSLTTKDIEFVNDMIFCQLNMQFMRRYKKAFRKLIDDLESGDFGKTRDDNVNLIDMFQTILTDLRKAQRRSRKENRFNLSDPELFNSMLAESINRALSDTQYWKTGMQGLNRMLGGGVEDSRIYNIIGATGGFKSGLLLNLMKQIKLNNRGHAHKDPNKRPTILFISQENNIWETMIRIFAIFGSTQNIKRFTAEKISQILKDGGFRLVEDDLDIDIEFRYYGNMEVGVPDLRGYVEELENEGREVIGIIQDYIERLRPPYMNVDRRLQLSDISNQLHDLAIDLDIWIITGSQLNREGVGTIEDMTVSGKHDIGKRMGSKYVSESHGMLKNFDVNIVIVVEYDSTEERYYLAFSLLKFRGDDSNSLRYFCQPFVGINSKIRLMEDINEERGLYRLSMTDELAAQLQDDVKSYEELRDHMSSRYQGIKELEEIDFEPITMDPDIEDISEFIEEGYEAQTRSEREEERRRQGKHGAFVVENGIVAFVPYPVIATRI